MCQRVLNILNSMNSSLYLYLGLVDTQTEALKPNHVADLGDESFYQLANTHTHTDPRKHPYQATCLCLGPSLRFCFISDLLRLMRSRCASEPGSMGWNRAS